MEFMPPGAGSDSSSVDHEAENSDQKQDWAILFKRLAIVTKEAKVMPLAPKVHNLPKQPPLLKDQLFSQRSSGGT